MRVTALWFVSIQPSIETGPPPRLTRLPSIPLASPHHPAGLPFSPLASPHHPAQPGLPVSAPNHASVRTPPPPPPGTMLGFATLVAFALPPCLISRRRHVSGLRAVSGSPSAPLRSPVRLQGERPV